MGTCSGPFVSRLAAVLLVAPGAAGAATAQASGDEEPEAEGEISLVPGEEEAGLVPWRGSEIIYNNDVGLNGLDRSSDLTWNPYWAMTWRFKPRWWFDDTWYVRARLDLSREVTQADDRTYSGETWVHDLFLYAGASDFYTIPVVDIGLSADVILTTPTSKVSRARTLALGIGSGVRIGRSFSFGAAGDLSVDYHVRFSSFLHRYTTSELETPIIPSCARSGSGCDEFINTGERNVQWRVQHGVGVSWEPLEWLEASVGFEHVVSWLYPIEGEDPRISHEAEDDTDRRYASDFYAEAVFAPWAPIRIGLGYGTISPQLAPDSTYHNPFYNRYSTIYLDLRIEVDGLVAQFVGEGS
ncbi:MAG: hypothetical protein QME96_09235 [Myxococcota bacterium]|nr:hypothetical protein [Myxococcota bacterium]